MCLKIWRGTWNIKWGRNKIRISSVSFLNKKTVCQGYANATQYLLTLLGIPAVVVTGTAEGDTHAWNLVQLDGAYYFMDTTWGNSSYNNGASGMGGLLSIIIISG